MAAFFRLRFPGVSLQRREGTLEESIVYHISFAVLAVDNPVALRHAAEASFGGNGFGVLTALHLQATVEAYGMYSWVLHWRIANIFMEDLFS
jgi:hypothetical protein